MTSINSDSLQSDSTAPKVPFVASAGEDPTAAENDYGLAMDDMHERSTTTEGSHSFQSTTADLPSTTSSTSPAA